MRSLSLNTNILKECSHICESAYFGFVGKYLNLNPNIRFNFAPRRPQFACQHRRALTMLVTWQPSLAGASLRRKDRHHKFLWKQIWPWCPIQNVLPLTDQRYKSTLQLDELFPNLNIYDFSNHICATSPGKDACTDDSGGPMFVSENERWVEKFQ